MLVFFLFITVSCGESTEEYKNRRNEEMKKVMSDEQLTIDSLTNGLMDGSINPDSLIAR